MQKKELRLQQIERLSKFAKTDEKKREEALIHQNLFSSKEYQQAKSIGLTYSEAIEVDTITIFHQALTDHKEVFFAKTFPKRQMHFLKVENDNQFERNNFGIQEPLADLSVNDQLDLLLVPSLLIKKESHFRLGFGGGYFDRFIEKNKPDTITLATTPVLTDDESLWISEDFDQPINKIITTER